MREENEGYLINFDHEIIKTYKQLSGVVPYYLKFGYDINRYFLYDYHDCRMGSRDYNPLSTLRKVLSPNGENEIIQIILKAFVYSEARFISNYIPQNSHEERLTGHLLSEYSSSLNIIKDTIEKKAYAIYNEMIELDFFYVDLSSNNAEKLTGADFGMLIHFDLPDSPERTIVATFQAKKIASNIKIDIKQLNTLIKYFPEGSNYCMYDTNTPQTNSPLVISAKNIQNSLDDKNSLMKNQNSITTINRDKLIDNYNCVPLSFIIAQTFFYPLNTNASIATFSSVWDAKNFFKEPSDTRMNRNNRIDKAIMLSLRAQSNKNNEFKLSRIF